MTDFRFIRAYAVEADGEIIGFVRGPDRWDAYLVTDGLVAVGQPTRSAAAEAIVEANPDPVADTA